jgi:hypothetical protein
VRGYLKVREIYKEKNKSIVIINSKSYRKRLSLVVSRERAALSSLQLNNNAAKSAELALEA